MSSLVKTFVTAFVKTFVTTSAVLALVAFTVFGPAASPPRAAIAVEATEVSFSVAVNRVQPAVATPGAPVNVQVSVSNAIATPLSGVVVRARLGSASLDTRKAVREFGAGTADPATREVATMNLTGPVARGRPASATLTLDPADIPSVRAYGALPLVIEAEAAGLTVRQRTYLPVHNRKEYEPLRLALAVPLTLDPDPALVTATGAELDKAWTRAAGDGSRIDRILTATEGLPVTFAVDPALVGYTDPGPDTADSTGEIRAAPATSSTIAGITASIVTRLTRGPATSVWELPPGDPDLSALSAPGADPRLLQSIASLPTDLPALLGRPDAAVPRIAWPVGEALDDARRVAVDTAFKGRPGGQQAAFVTGSATVDTDPDISGPAARRTPGGSSLLVADQGLGATLAGITRGLDAGAYTQRFLADSLALLAEAPGRSRTVLVAAPRRFAPDAGALGSLLTTLNSPGGVPWVDLVSTDELIAASTSPQAPQAVPRTPQSASVPVSPLQPAAISRLISTGQHIAGISSVLSATDTSGRIPRASTIQSLASARWRGQVAAFEATNTAVQERVDTLATGVTVLPSTVNFLADHGVLQVTVVNNLDVAVHNVRLVLDPQGRPPRLRVTEPQPLSIAPGSRTTVRVSVDAVAAGVVPVSTYLTTATGTRLGADAMVNVRVQPTGGWVVAVGGVLVGVTFLVGLYRTFRRGRPRVTEAELEGIDLE